jgi:NAD(P)-dependent dehydrogenase (short-subunit alcohol dehydrogenase family)
MAGRLEGKIALVTGGCSGIGLATAQRFVKEGAHVYITGRRQRELVEAVKTIGGNVTGIQADVSNPADLDRLYAQIKREKGNSTPFSLTPAGAPACHSAALLKNNTTIRSTPTSKA